MPQIYHLFLFHNASRDYLPTTNSKVKQNNLFLSIRQVKLVMRNLWLLQHRKIQIFINGGREMLKQPHLYIFFDPAVLLIEIYFTLDPSQKAKKRFLEMYFKEDRGHKNKSILNSHHSQSFFFFFVHNTPFAHSFFLPACPSSSCKIRTHSWIQRLTIPSCLYGNFLMTLSPFSPMID